MFEDSVAFVVGIPYSAWRHAGVVVLAHDEGTARAVKFWIAGVSLIGEENTGRWLFGLGNL